MRTSTRKTKASSSNDLEAEFYTPQKVKLSEPKTSKKKQLIETNDKENENNNEEKITVKLRGRSSKKVVIMERRPEEEEEGQKMASRDRLTPSKSRLLEEAKVDMSKKEQVEFTEILESKYIPQTFLYREKEKSDMFNFILK